MQLMLIFTRYMKKKGSVYLLLLVFHSCFGFFLYGQEELRPRQQPPVPDGWKEDPFVETVPVPVLTRPEQKTGFLLFSRPVTEPVYKNTHPLPQERTKKIKIFATPGEFEPITFSIYPARDLNNLHVSISALKGKAGKIPEENLDIRLVTYWNIRYPYWISEGTYRNVPELLEKVTVNDVKKEECQRYWIIAHIPEYAKEGLYRGEIKIKDDNMREPVILPVECKVLGFVLKKDPHKHYSAYFSQLERQYRDIPDSLYEKAVNNELKAMRDYGLDMFPSITLSSDGDHAFVSDKMKNFIDKMLKMGFSGPAPVDGEQVVIAILEKYEGLVWKPHWKLDRMPSDSFYQRVTNVFRDFIKEWKQKKWPEVYLNAADEVDPSVRDFGVRVYQAVKEAGVKTYITKSSTDKDAKRYSPYVDAWCSQPFDVPYEKAVSGNYEYWCYPNHVAGERKNRHIMMKGGRMTYGFGFWRSGYTVLIPWHWRWITSDNPFEYINARAAPCGMRMDENGNIIPAVYWECFREGYDDERYIYTLEQAIAEREGSDKCAALVKESVKLLRNIWDSIHVQPKYMDTGMWPSEEFNEYRWEIARYITALLKYPPEKKVIAPSVLPDILKDDRY